MFLIIKILGCQQSIQESSAAFLYFEFPQFQNILIERKF